jgi:hypothetical protein
MFYDVCDTYGCNRLSTCTDVNVDMTAISLKLGDKVHITTLIKYIYKFRD